MQTMNSELAKLFLKGQISQKDALGRSPDPDALQKMIGT
jgi:Tfp pilus assembly pilus retraction ATPase PilT